MSSINSTFENANAKDAILYPYILAITYSQLSISSVGFVLNGSLVYVVIKNKSMQNSMGLFLCICSLCDMMVELSIVPPTILVLNRVRIPLLTCAYFTVHSTGCNSNSYFNLFFLSCDRLFAVAFPVRYKMRITRIGIRKYVALLNCISIGYVILNSSFAIRNAVDHPEILVYCEPGDIYQGDAVVLSYHAMMVVTLTAVFNYVVMYFILKKMNKQEQDAGNQRESTRKIFKSLVLIMVVIFFSYPLYGYTKGTLVNWLKDTILIYFIKRNQLVPIAQAINAPILFICSSQYREAFKKEFKLIKHCCFSFSKVSPNPNQFCNSGAMFANNNHSAAPIYCPEEYLI